MNTEEGEHDVGTSEKKSLSELLENSAKSYLVGEREELVTRSRKKCTWRERAGKFGWERFSGFLSEVT